MDTVAVVTSDFPALRREQMWNAMQRLVLNGLSSPHTRRAYLEVASTFGAGAGGHLPVDDKPLSAFPARASWRARPRPQYDDLESGLKHAGPRYVGVHRGPKVARNVGDVRQLADPCRFRRQRLRDWQCRGGRQPASQNRVRRGVYWRREL
jgi:hypothetical protein